MDKYPNISVLMPVYNGQKYLKQAIESILNQKFKDFEFLIIDDGSTDKSDDIIREYQKEDSRIVYIKNEKNFGIVHSLNRGIELAKGRYIARMDCDDVSLPNRLEMQSHFMDEHPEIGVCGTWFKFIPTGDIIRYPINHDDIKLKLLTGNALAHPTVIFRARMLKENNIKYDENAKHCEDYELWVRLSRITRLANMSEVLLDYRMHGSQISIFFSKEQRSNASEVRINQLRELGVVFSIEEMEIYLELIAGEGICDKNVINAKNLIQKIIEANKINKIYSEKKFKIKLDELLNKSQAEKKCISYKVINLARSVYGKFRK